MSARRRHAATQPAQGALRPTRAEIDLDVIAANARAIREAAERPLLAVVKCDAYGHGVLPVALRLSREGVFGFGVALAEEGLQLRQAGIEETVLVMNGVYGDAHRSVLEAKLTPVVYRVDEVERFADAAGGAPFGVHLKVDTGMGRLGVAMDQLDRFLDRFGAVQGATLEGVMTHLASAESDDAFTEAQLDAFDAALGRIRARGHAPRWCHAANSAGTLRHPRARHDLVRTGGALWGHPGYAAGDAPVEVRPAMRVRTQIVSLRDVSAGASVGYCRTFTATRPTRIATIPVGYGDGLLRAASNRGLALVRGRRCRIVGNVSMDLTTLDVTDVPDVTLGDEAVLLGEQGEDRLTPEEVAEAYGTIPYEVFTSVSRRVPRVHRGT